MSILNDIKFALRLLVKQPTSSALAILVLALGTGLAITMFAFINGVLWSEPNLKTDREILVLEWQKTGNIRFDRKRGIGPLDFEVFQEETESFEHMAAFTWGNYPFYNPSGDAFTKRYWCARVTAGFFQTVGETPLLGRTFLPEDVSRSQDDTIVLSYKLWQEQFAGDNGVVGAMAIVDGQPYRVVGVMRSGFHFPDEVEFWIATAWQKEKANSRMGRGITSGIRVIAVLKEGATMGQAKTELTTIAGRLAREYPKTNESKLAVDMTNYTRWFLRIPQRFASASGKTFEHASYALFVCAVLVLGVACANVFNLIMTRTTQRSSELSIRNALGAGRGHIVIQVLLDGLILTAFGAIGGILIAGWSLKLAKAKFGQMRYVPDWWQMDMDGVVLCFVLGIVLVSALASSLIPGLRASRTFTSENLKDESRTSSTLFIGRLSKLILSIQVTVTGLLAFVSIMMLLIWVHMKNREFPFEAESIVVAPLRATQVASQENKIAQIGFEQRLKEKLEAYPGIERVCFTLRWNNPRTFKFDGEEYENIESQPQTVFKPISPGYEKVYGVELLAGRSFNTLDTMDTQKVCMVNKTFADHFWPNEDPIGKRIRYYGPHTVVGVMPDVQPKPLPGENIEQGGYTRIYLPLSQIRPTSGWDLMLRIHGDSSQWLEPMKQALRETAPDSAFYNIRIWEGENRYAIKVSLDIAFGMFGVFGLAAIITAFIGLYSVMSFSTRQRFREFGIRMAMGADSRQIIISVIKQRAILLTLCGILGIALGHAISMSLKSFIGVPELPIGITYPIVMGILILAAVLAMGVPAWRASRMQPIKALRID